jgi:uncharacterized protein YrrD
MRITLGQDVFARDGRRVGTVDRLVLNDETHNVEEIVVHKGVFFSSDKILDRSLIRSVDEDGVHLSIDAAEERKLPTYYSGQYYEWSPDDVAIFPQPVPGWYAGSLLSINPPGEGRGYPGTDSLFELAPLDAPRVRPESNVSEFDVKIGPGAAVVCADGSKLGHVHDVVFDETGALTSIVVRSGLVRKRDREIPAVWIAEIDDDRLWLSVTADEAVQTPEAAPAN